MFHYLTFRIFVFQKYQQGDGDEHEHLFELIQVKLRNIRGENLPFFTSRKEHGKPN
jgi:hypothetical protein